MHIIHFEEYLFYVNYLKWRVIHIVEAIS